MHLHIWLVVVWLLFPVFARAQGPNEAILHEIDAHYNHLSSLQCRYTEHYAGMGMDRTESGTLLLKKPGRMRWTYDTPAGKLFVLDGKFGWFYTPGDSQAQRVSAQQLDDLRSPLRFLLGHTRLSKELKNLSVKPIPQGFEVAGTPIALNERVRQMTLFVSSTGAILMMRMDEGDGSSTAFTFSDQHENFPTKDSDFRFMPPPGVGVVNGLPPL